MDNNTKIGLIARSVATAVVWVMVAGSIALTGIFLAPAIGEDALGAIFMIMIAAVLSNGFIWNWGRGNKLSRRDMQKRRELEEELYDMALHNQAKRKRNEIGTRLTDMSDDELLDLRQRLQSGDIDEGEIAHLLQG